MTVIKQHYKDLGQIKTALRFMCDMKYTSTCSYLILKWHYKRKGDNSLYHSHFCLLLASKGWWVISLLKTASAKPNSVDSHEMLYSVVSHQGIHRLTFSF